MVTVAGSQCAPQAHCAVYLRLLYAGASQGSVECGFRAGKIRMHGRRMLADRTMRTLHATATPTCTRCHPARCASTLAPQARFRARNALLSAAGPLHGAQAAAAFATTASHAGPPQARPQSDPLLSCTIAMLSSSTQLAAFSVSLLHVSTPAHHDAHCDVRVRVAV